MSRNVQKTITSKHIFISFYASLITPCSY